ncbi:hypothetical protein ACFQ9X_28010 [Catenulispora yoronensis]
MNLGTNTADPPATEQPGNSFRYLYWRLSEKEFQQLCGALLRHKYGHVTCYPVGMADGGIDAISFTPTPTTATSTPPNAPSPPNATTTSPPNAPSPPNATTTSAPTTIYQVKWTTKLLQNPETWLSRTIESERPNILRLIKDHHASRYIIMTSVAGTPAAIQRLEAKLQDYSAQLGIPIECWWQADIDAEVDAAPDSIKWSYQEMLAGSDAIRHLLHSDPPHLHRASLSLSDSDSPSPTPTARTRDMILRVMATQWREDSRVKFSQVEMDGVSIVDLFIDVHLSVGKHQPVSFGYREQEIADEAQESLNAIDYLLRPYIRRAFLLGVPGQGKSTLGQYLCQIHRAALLPNHDTSGYPHVDEPMFPLRVDLKDYAAWLSGSDPFDFAPTDLTPSPLPIPAATPTPTPTPIPTPTSAAKTNPP